MKESLSGRTRNIKTSNSLDEETKKLIEDSSKKLKKTGQTENNDNNNDNNDNTDNPDDSDPTGFPQWTTHKCLVRKVMDEDMQNKLSKLKTSKGFTLDYAIKAGVKLPHVGVGITNDGIESLNLFKEL